jgi:hyperosmotically inducible protein
MKINKVYRSNNTLILSCLSAILLLTACDQKGPAEKAGQKIDQASEKAGNELDNLKATVTQKVDNADGYVDDAIITAKAKELLLTDSEIKSAKIEVITVQGVVTLSGTLTSELLVNRAGDLIKAQKGVKSVQNNLLVSAEIVAK